MNCWVFALALFLTSMPAMAQDTPPPTGGMGSLIPLILIFVIFYFLIIRPQSKKIKAHASMVSALEKGDTVITAGGVEGVITKVEDTMLELRIAEGVVIRVVRSTVSDKVEGVKAKKVAKEDGSKTAPKPKPAVKKKTAKPSKK